MRWTRAFNLDVLLRVLVVVLVTGVAGLAFFVSFESIKEYVQEIDAFPDRHAWCAPLLVDTFIVAGSLAGFRRARIHQTAVYPWMLVAVGTGISTYLNVQHAPEGEARWVAALPSLALLTSFELLLAETRRTGQYESLISRGWRAWRLRGQDAPATPGTPTMSTPLDAEPSEAGMLSARDQVRELLRSDPPAEGWTAAKVADLTGVSRSRAGELLKQERAKLNGKAGS